MPHLFECQGDNMRTNGVRDLDIGMPPIFEDEAKKQVQREADLYSASDF